MFKCKSTRSVLFTWLGALIQPLVVRMLCFGLGECIGHPVRSGYCLTLQPVGYRLSNGLGDMAFRIIPFRYL